MTIKTKIDFLPKAEKTKNMWTADALLERFRLPRVQPVLDQMATVWLQQ